MGGCFELRGARDERRNEQLMRLDSSLAWFGEEIVETGVTGFVHAALWLSEVVNRGCS